MKSIVLVCALVAGCAQTHEPSALERACGNYADNLGCNPVPGTAFTFARCLETLAPLPPAELECLSAVSRCEDAPTSVRGAQRYIGCRGLQ